MDNAQKIWDKLISAGLTEAGAAGLMGNLYAESGLRPDNLQNSCEKKLGYSDADYTAAADSGAYTCFVTDGAGYGLAQWTYPSRKAALLAYVKARGRSVGDLDAQVDYLLQELQAVFRGVLDKLRTTASIRAASDCVLLQFERPADQSPAVRARRAGYAQEFYDTFAVKGESATTPQERLIATAKDQVGYLGKKTNAELDYLTVNAGNPSTVMACRYALGGENIKGYGRLAWSLVPEEKEEDEMVYYKNLDDVPGYYRDAVKKAVDRGALNGTGDGINVSEDLCRTLTVLDRMGKLD